MNIAERPAAAPAIAQATAGMVVEVSQLTRQFGDGASAVHALRGIDLALAPGSFTGLTDPSGSGKSTLLHLVGLLDRPTSGTTAFNGRVLDPDDEIAARNLRRTCLGFVFQNYNLVPSLSAAENVELALFHLRLGARARRDKACAALEMVGLADRLDHLPRQMSGGQQQRVAVARALVREPLIVLADEPTANLDTGNALKLMELMMQLHERTGTAFLVSTHDHRLIPHFPRVIALEDGRILP